MTSHLIHVGFHKTGSMSLRRWFARHPQIIYTEGGLGGARTIYEICRQGSAPASSRCRVTSCEGLATPHVEFGQAVVDHDAPLLQPLAASRAAVCGSLAALFPNAQILVVTRGFGSMLPSCYSQLVRSGGRWSCEEMYAGIRKGLATDYHLFDYDAVIDLYRRAFGDDRVIALPYEWLRDDPAAFCAHLETRLGLDHANLDVERINEALSPAELYWYPRLARRVHGIASWFGDRLRRHAVRRYVRLAMANRLRRPIRVLEWVWPRRIIRADAPLDVLALCRGKAERLRDDPVYARYAREYLWAEAPEGGTGPRPAARPIEEGSSA